jgi:hypothetical protein
MKRKNIPKKNATINQIEQSPDNSGSSFSDRFPYCSSRKLHIPAHRVITQMDVIGERQACASSATIPQIPTDPDRICFCRHGGHKQCCKAVTSAGWSVYAVKIWAFVPVRIEYVGKSCRA